MPDPKDLIHDAARRSAETMTAKAETLREVLRAQAPAAVALRSGASYDGRQITLAYLGTDYAITCPGFEVCRDGAPTYPFMQAIILSYLHDADGTPRANRWVAFRELRGGQFYHQAFTGYTGRYLAAQLGNDLAAFERGAAPLADTRLTDYGDAAYAFRTLPNLHMVAIYWLGDDEFAPRASILFDAAAEHYLSLDGLAVVGSQLVSRILKGARAS
jgi:hypothetical protein